MADIKSLKINGVSYAIKDAVARQNIDDINTALESVFGQVDYDSVNKLIKFYAADDTLKETVLGSLDATAFIKDGMVSTVAINNGKLVITFNTDAGKEPIEINISDIFDASNYYTKTQVDTALGLKANSADLATVATSGSYNDLTDKPVIPEGAVIDSEFSATSTNAVQNRVVKNALDAKANSADLATVATSGDYADLSNKPTIPTVPSNVSAFTNDAGYLTQHQDLSSYSTTAQMNSAISTAIASIDNYDAENEILELTFG